MKKRVLTLLLACLMLIPTLSCATPVKEEAEKTVDFVIVEGGTAKYTIILTRKESVGEVNCADKLYKALGGASVEGLQYLNDFMTEENDSDPNAYEILFGNANRTMTAKVAEMLNSPKDYIIYTENNRIFVYSEDIAGMSQATEYLISHIVTENGNTIIRIPEKVYKSYEYTHANLKIEGVDISNYVMVVPDDNAGDETRANAINDWLRENVGLTIDIFYGSEQEHEYEILIGDTGRTCDTISSTLKSGEYKLISTEKKTFVCYKGAAPSLITKLLEAFATDSVSSLSVEGSEDAYTQFRYDNFADGRLSDELLDSVNPGVLAELSDCMYFEYCLQEGKKKGQKWVYSNKSVYVPQSGTFDSMLESGKYGTNCAMGQAWVLVDLGVITNGKHVWGERDYSIKNVDKYGKYMTAVGTIYKWNGKYTFMSMYKMGLIEAGDIFYVYGHTFLYLGDEKFLAMGHDGGWHADASVSTKTEDTQHAVFDTFVKSIYNCGNSNYDVYWIYRFNDDFIPKYYRNAAGKLVDNPMFDESTSVYYKAGVSSEETVIVEGKR